MKKLLITTMAAASLAFCAKAADEVFSSSINFESFAEGDTLSFNSEESDGNVYWSTDSEDGLFVVSNLTSFASTYPTSRPAHWADDASNLRALFIDSDKPLMRNVNPKESGSEGEVFRAYQLQNEGKDRNLFFDSVVQFTATDTAPTVDYDAGDKLIAWLYYSEDASESNPGIFGETTPLKRLVITAGYYDGNTRTTKNYLTSLEIEPDTWHRLTIKAINNIGEFIPGFQVWVDRNQIGGVLDYLNEEATAVTTFPSLAIADGGGVNTVTGVAFDGKGAVDDLVFTTTDPFAEASYAVTVTVTDESWTSWGVAKYYSVNGGTTYADLADGDNAELYSSGMTISIAQTAENILFKVPVPEGYKLEDGTATTETPDEGANYYWTKQLSVADIINTDGVGTVALVYVADDGTEEETYKLAISAENATIDGLTAGNYAKGTNFVFTVTPADGYQVTSVMMNTTVLELNTEGKYAFQMPDGDVTVTVTVEAKSYELTLTAANATVKGVETGMYAYNSEISFKVEVASDYTLKGVTMNDNALTAGDDGSYTFTMPAADVALVVTTEKTQEEEAAQPTVNGTAATDADDFKDAAKSGSTITLPTGWKLDTETGVITDADGNTYATFESYYTATPGEDGTSFTVAFNDTAKPEVGDSTAGDAIAVTTDTVTLGITNAKKDLYYTVKAYSDVACTKALGAGDSVQADEDGVLSISITKPANVDAAFFKVQVTDKEVETTEAGTEE